MTQTYPRQFVTDLLEWVHAQELKMNLQGNWISPKGDYVAQGSDQLIDQFIKACQAGMDPTPAVSPRNLTEPNRIPYRPALQDGRAIEPVPLTSTLYSGDSKGGTEYHDYLVIARDTRKRGVKPKPVLAAQFKAMRVYDRGSNLQMPTCNCCGDRFLHGDLRYWKPNYDVCQPCMRTWRISGTEELQDFITRLKEAK